MELLFIVWNVSSEEKASQSFCVCAFKAETLCTAVIMLVLMAEDGGYWAGSNVSTGSNSSINMCPLTLQLAPTG